MRKYKQSAPIIFGIESVYSNDHDSMAGYDRRIGYRYKTQFTIRMSSKSWTQAKKFGLGNSGLIVDVANCVYNTYGFKQTYIPQVDTHARAKQGFVNVTFTYFHNSDEDALRTGYNFEDGYMRFHQKAKEKYTQSQWDLDPNNQVYGEKS